MAVFFAFAGAAFGSVATLGAAALAATLGAAALAVTLGAAALAATLGAAALAATLGATALAATLGAAVLVVFLALADFGSLGSVLAAAAVLTERGTNAPMPLSVLGRVTPQDFLTLLPFLERISPFPMNTRTLN